MPYIEWDDSLLINVEEIDNQHKRLFDLINDLHEKLKSGKGHEVLAPTIAAMVKYVKEHFASEEAFMQEIEYPEYEKQKQEHEAFFAKVKEFYAKYRDNTPLLAREILMFLSAWYRNHIIINDKKIGEYAEGRVL